MAVIRTRWAAIGAAVAIALGGGGIGLVSATTPTGASALVPITPCRIADTRPATQVGPKASPVGPNETYTIGAHGSNGNCTIPASATGLSMNVTAVGATANTFLTLWGAGARPIAANLNPRAGGPPTPNSVTSPLSGGGQFSVYNKAGNVDIIIDIVGYYTDHSHDDRYYTKAQSGDRYYTKTQANARYAPRETLVVVDGLDFEYFGSNWSKGPEFLQRGGGSSSSCASAPVKLPEGASVTGVTVVYLSFSGTVDVEIIGLSRAAGVYDSDVLTSGTGVLPFVGEFIIGRVSVPVDTSEPIDPDRSYSVDVCTLDPLYISAIEITMS